MNNEYRQQNYPKNSVDESAYYLLPANGGGALVERKQVIGARPNGNDGAIVYTEAGPSIYTTLTTQELAKVFGARSIRKEMQ